MTASVGGHFHPAIRLASALIALSCDVPAFAAKCDRVSRPLQVSATPISFGNYNAASVSAATANGTITVSCVNAANDLPPFSVALSKGSSSIYSPRTMTLGANTLNYNIYTSAAFTAIWGDGTGGTVTVDYNGAGNPNSLNYTAYGSVPAGQYVTPGSYTDTIQVTVTY
jgi:spore coat protein U-like protein